MTGHYPWEDLIKTWSPERRAASEARADKMYAEILRERRRQERSTGRLPAGSSQHLTGEPSDRD